MNGQNSPERVLVKAFYKQYRPTASPATAVSLEVDALLPLPHFVSLSNPWPNFGEIIKASILRGSQRLWLVDHFQKNLFDRCFRFHGMLCGVQDSVHEAFGLTSSAMAPDGYLRLHIKPSGIGRRMFSEVDLRFFKTVLQNTAGDPATTFYLKKQHCLPFYMWQRDSMDAKDAGLGFILETFYDEQGQRTGHKYLEMRELNGGLGPAVILGMDLRMSGLHRVLETQKYAFLLDGLREFGRKSWTVRVPLYTFIANERAQARF